MRSRFLPQNVFDRLTPRAPESQPEVPPVRVESAPVAERKILQTPPSNVTGSVPDPNIPGNVLICHDTTSGPITISVPPSMLGQYQAASDYDGRCANNNSSTYCPTGSAPDCAGVCNGPSILDCAGVCYNPETTPIPHLRDCAGECYDVECGPKHIPDCNGVCGGHSYKDCGGVCGGTSTPDCNGVCGGSAYQTCDGQCVTPCGPSSNRNGQVSRFIAKNGKKRK